MLDQPVSSVCLVLWLTLTCLLAMITGCASSRRSVCFPAADHSFKVVLLYGEQPHLMAGSEAKYEFAVICLAYDEFFGFVTAPALSCW